MLFRPEEVVPPSASAAVDVRLIRSNLDQFASVKDQANALCTVGAGVIDYNPLIGVSAADQQQKVNCSGHIELLTVFQRHSVEIEAQAFEQTLVTGG